MDIFFGQTERNGTLIWIREWRYLMGVHLSCYMLHVKR